MSSSENGLVVDGEGTKRWYQNGKIHREDGPAVEFPDGSKIWYRHGLRHRDEGPAAEYADGTKYWYQNGNLHREDGPAVEYPNGAQEWYRNGVRHREEGPAYVSQYESRTMDYWYLHGIYIGMGEKPDPKLWTMLISEPTPDGPIIDAKGDKIWHKNGIRHRDEGPAVETFTGEKHWYKDGKLHREDGPAVEYPNGSKEWIVNGKSLGGDQKGFWDFWNSLPEEKKRNPNLLKYLP